MRKDFMINYFSLRNELFSLYIYTTLISNRQKG